MTRQSMTPCTVVLAASTVPFVVGLMMMKTLSDVFIQMGQASEEIFRGDRLPILHHHTRGRSDVQNGDS
ncbi:MAG: hypothetical protein AAGA75_04210 [Cyanobacteria bacterium P01_E01_bin.6]